MKARLIPVYFRSGMDKDYTTQVQNLKLLLSDVADILEPQSVSAKLPEAEAVVFPQLIGDAFKQIEDIKKITLPFIALTSEFGTVNMWDWEIVSFLQSEGLTTFTPYNIELTKTVCKSLALKREMKQTKFLVFQDNPGDGMQAEIFKRFYWWEDRCTQLIQEKFGIGLIKKSFKKLGEDAKRISDAEAEKVWNTWKSKLPTEGLTQRAVNSAVKLYIALKQEIEKDGSIRGAGINCLNESFHSDTTPCLAWSMLFEEKDLLWICEADTVSLLTKHLVYRSLGVPIIMSNVYPFNMGMAALKHERIQEFPKVEEPENHMLIAHCGYFALMPKCFASHWTLKPKVLKIVDDNATAVDARLPEGDVTLLKLDPTLSRLTAVEGVLEGYVQYPGSDCRNGGIIKVKDGHAAMEKLVSHHQLIMIGHRKVELKQMAKALGLAIEIL